jgi:hypothetical protein
VETEKENLRKTVQTVLKMFLSVLHILAEMGKSIQEKFVMIENKTEKIKNVRSLVLLPIHLLPSVEMGKLIQVKPVKIVLKMSKDASLFAEMES